jgi:DNA-binding response OmpR family regulator
VSALPPADPSTDRTAAEEPEPDEDAHSSYRLPSEGDPLARDPDDRRLAVLLYSDDVLTRERVRLAVGRRAAPGLPEIAWTECATGPAVLEAVDRGGLDVLILDGEATPAGGLGLCKQLKDEIYRCPPVLVLTGRPQDAWLATWSRADRAVPHPLDPLAVAEAVATLARRRPAS